MASQRAHEKEVWKFLLGFLSASAADEIGFDDYESLPEAEQERINKAIERVFFMIGRHT
jgi:hypothetical protein